MSRIVIVDYGLGNMRSVSRALEKAGAATLVSQNPEEISAAEGIILPGVGAFHEGMTRLSDLAKAITDSKGHAQILGICLGMQMMMEESHEHGLNKGLGLIPGTVKRFSDAGRVLSYVLIFLFLIPLSYNYSENDKSRDYMVKDYVFNLFNSASSKELFKYLFTNVSRFISGSIDKDAVIIGGTEGPTVIWLTTGNVAYVAPMLFCVLLLVNAYALCKSTNSGGVRNPI